MNAWESIKEKRFNAPGTMKPIEWALWNGRAELSDTLLEYSAAELVALQARIAELEGERVDLKRINTRLGEAVEHQAARIRELQMKESEFLSAVDFYAKRYHDEHHMGDTYQNCIAESCEAASALTKADA